MKKAIALDYDGVIADTNQIKSDLIKKHLGRDVSPWKCNRSDCEDEITKEAYDLLSCAVYGHDLSRRAEPVHGAIAGIHALSRMYDLYIVTARTQERIEWAREWLAQHGIAHAFQGILASSDDIPKAEIVHQLGAIALIEDDIRHLKKPSELQFARIHLTPGESEKAKKYGVVTVKDWASLVMVLKDLEGSEE